MDTSQTCRDHQLHVQRFLKSNSLKDLSDQYGIKVKEHEHFVGLNYHQIKSPKAHPITVECRSLKLHKDRDWTVAGRAFDRFFNFGESPDQYSNFDMDTAVAMEKLDGSIISIWYNKIDMKWEVASRSGIFGDTVVKPESRKTFRDLVLDLLPNFNDIFEKCSKDHTFIFEYIGPDNKIVTPYKESQLVLLGIRSIVDGLYKDISEMTDFVNYKLQKDAYFPPVRMPKLYDFKTIQDIVNFARELTSRDEGFVCWDVKNGLRVKIKSPHYVKLHRMRGNNGEKSVKDIIGLIVTGETEEMLVYFPEFREIIKTVDKIINDTFNKADTLYCDMSSEQLSQKDFAQKVFNCEVAKSMKNLFFSARKNDTTPTIEFKKLAVEQQVSLIDKYIVEHKIQM
jgi:T4 RnlA family RNA ligase